MTAGVGVGGRHGFSGVSWLLKKEEIKQDMIRSYWEVEETVRT